MGEADDMKQAQYGGKRAPPPAGTAIDGASLRRNQYVKYDAKGDVVPFYRNCSWLLYWDWLIHFWRYWDTIPHFIAWYSCAGFYFGAIFFIIGTFAYDFKTVSNEGVNGFGNCMHDVFDWTVTFTYFLGNILWQPAVLFQVFEAMNHDYEAKYEEWFLSGMQGKKPRYRWVGFYYWSLEWWGGMCYFIGVIGYNMASFVSIMYDCIYINTTLETWLVAYTYMGAGILFMAAGGLYIMAFTDITMMSAIWIPFNKKAATSMMWWALWMYWWGGVLFCMSGFFLYWDSGTNLVITTTQYKWEQSIGFGLGSIFFHFGAQLLLMRQARGRCRPSMAQVHSRYDPTAHAGERREEGATAKGIPPGFTKQAHYGDPLGSDPKMEQV